MHIITSSLGGAEICILKLQLELELHCILITKIFIFIFTMQKVCNHFLILIHEHCTFNVAQNKDAPCMHQGKYKLLVKALRCKSCFSSTVTKTKVDKEIKKFKHEMKMTYKMIHQRNPIVCSDSITRWKLHRCISLPSYIHLEQNVSSSPHNFSTVHCVLFYCSNFSNSFCARRYFTSKPYIIFAQINFIKAYYVVHKLILLCFLGCEKIDIFVTYQSDVSVLSKNMTLWKG